MDESIRNLYPNVVDNNISMRKSAYTYLKNYFTKQSIIMKNIKPIHSPKQIVHGFMDAKDSSKLYC